MLLRRCQPSEARNVLRWIKEHHYLRSTPPGFVVVLEFLEAGKRVGAMQLGRPTSRELDAARVLELNRMYFIDEMPTNTESRALGMMRKFVRTWFPKVKLLLAYSDPSVGHHGTVYEADNWAPFGRTKRVKGYGWNNRGGRRETMCEPKIRWVRTP
jgi:hypothetical protein